MTVIAIRHPLDIQKAHDLLSCLLELPDLFETLIPDKTGRDCMIAALNALCWVLGHEDIAVDVFELNIRGLEEKLRRLGLAMQDMQDEEPGGGAKAETTH